MAPNGGLKIGRIFGIPIYVHSSWVIIFALITLTLRTQFSAQHASWSARQNWSLGVITSLLFFASVLFHELAHSVVAMRYKIPVVSITLFVFGGLARIGREAASAGQEFNIAIAGPISSYFLSAVCYLLAPHSGRFEMLGAAAWWLAGINAALATFNLAPGFPLDGGRILRAIAWGITKDFAKATRIASRSGQVLAYLLILFGVWQAFNGNWVNGLWLAFIGWFLRTAAQETYAQVAIQSTLAGLRAADIMTPDVPTVPRDMSLEDYVQEVLRTGRRCHIVTGNGVPVGLVTLRAVSGCPREEWSNTSLQAVMRKVDEIQWAAPAESVLGILSRMRERDINQMPVLEEGRIVGIVARDAILRVLQTRIQVGDQLTADRTRP